MSEQTYQQEYYAKNKDRVKQYIKEKTQCECGTVTTRLNLPKHRRTKLHQNRMNHNKYLETLIK